MFRSLLLWEEEEAVQADGRRGDSGGRAGQADAPQEEEESYLCAEEKALVRRGLHSCRLTAGSSSLSWLYVAATGASSRTEHL